MTNAEKYNHLRISANQLLQKLSIMDRYTLNNNAFEEGSIVKVPVGNVDGKQVFQQFEFSRGQFRDLGLTV